MKFHLITVAMVLYGYLSLVMSVTEAKQPFKGEAAPTSEYLDNAVAGILKSEKANAKQHLQEPIARKNFADITAKNVGGEAEVVVIWPSAYCGFAIETSLSEEVQINGTDGGNTIVTWTRTTTGAIIKFDPNTVRKVGCGGEHVVVTWPTVVASCNFTIKDDLADVELHKADSGHIGVYWGDNQGGTLTIDAEEKDIKIQEVTTSVTLSPNP